MNINILHQILQGLCEKNKKMGNITDFLNQDNEFFMSLRNQRFHELHYSTHILTLTNTSNETTSTMIEFPLKLNKDQNNNLLKKKENSEDIYLDNLLIKYKEENNDEFEIIEYKKYKKGNFDEKGFYLDILRICFFSKNYPNFSGSCLLIKDESIVHYQNKNQILEINITTNDNDFKKIKERAENLNEIQNNDFEQILDNNMKIIRNNQTIINALSDLSKQEKNKIAILLNINIFGNKIRQDIPWDYYKVLHTKEIKHKQLKNKNLKLELIDFSNLKLLKKEEKEFLRLASSRLNAQVPEATIKKINKFILENNNNNNDGINETFWNFNGQDVYRQEDHTQTLNRLSDFFKYLLSRNQRTYGKFNNKRSKVLAYLSIKGFISLSIRNGSQNIIQLRNNDFGERNINALINEVNNSINDWLKNTNNRDELNINDDVDVDTIFIDAFYLFCQYKPLYQNKESYNQIKEMLNIVHKITNNDKSNNFYKRPNKFIQKFNKRFPNGIENTSEEQFKIFLIELCL